MRDFCNYALMVVSVSNTGELFTFARQDANFLTVSKIDQSLCTLIGAGGIEQNFLNTAGILPQATGYCVETENKASIGHCLLDDEK